MKKIFVRIGQMLMAALGFSAVSCEKINGGFGGGLQVMYGCPYANYQSKGSVSDTAGSPLEGIKVSYYGCELATTGKDGKFAIDDTAGFLYEEKDTLVLNFHDVDGPDNGGNFEDASAVVKLTRTDDGSSTNVWFMGDYVGSDVNVVMKKKD